MADQTRINQRTKTWPGHKTQEETRISCNNHPISSRGSSPISSQDSILALSHRAISNRNRATSNPISNRGYQQQGYQQPGYPQPYQQPMNPAMAGQQKDWMMTLLLCIFGGAIGLHSFYVGKTTNGILQVVTLGGCGIWTIIDLISIVTDKYTDSRGMPLLKKQ